VGRSFRPLGDRDLALVSKAQNTAGKVMRWMRENDLGEFQRARLCGERLVISRSDYYHLVFGADGAICQIIGSLPDQDGDLEKAIRPSFSMTHLTDCVDTMREWLQSAQPAD